jgi:integrase
MRKSDIDKLVYEGDGKRRCILWDKSEPGFGVRVYPPNNDGVSRKVFVLSYRNRDAAKRLFTIGAYGAFTLDLARKEAQKIKRAITAGNDPTADRKRLREAPTMKALADRYLTEHAEKHKRPASVRDDRSMLDKIILPQFGSRKVRSITFDDIEALHASLKDTPYRANRVVALLSKMLSLASTRWRGWTELDHNPAKGVRRYAEEGRERFLSPEELARLAKALAEHPDQASANAVRLLLLTGARRSEILLATWDQFDFETGVWTKPSAHTKQKRIHRLPLSAAARELLVKMKADAIGPFLFPGSKEDKPMTNFRPFWEFWRDICKAAGIGGVRVHDLRHSHASILASAGISLTLIGAMLGHTQVATTKRYSHLFDDPLRAAADRVGGLFVAVSNGHTGDVVKLKNRL